MGQQEDEADLQQDSHQETECQNSRPNQSGQQQKVTSTPSPRKRLRLEILNEENPIEDNNYYEVKLQHSEKLGEDIKQSYIFQDV